MFPQSVGNGGIHRREYESNEQTLDGTGITPLGVGIHLGQLFVEGVQVPKAVIADRHDLQDVEQFACRLPLVREKVLGQCDKQSGQKDQRQLFV